MIPQKDIVKELKTFGQVEGVMLVGPEVEAGRWAFSSNIATTKTLTNMFTTLFTLFPAHVRQSVIQELTALKVELEKS